MLPIFRLIPVGGVFLAIAILLLALNPPQATSSSARTPLPARGALLDRSEHPEWRQFLILAAVRRAGEVERLRDLRDTVVRAAPLPAPTTADLEPAAKEPEIAAPAAAALKAAEPKVVEPKIADATEARPEVAEPATAAPSVVAAPKPMIDEPKLAEATPGVAEPKAAAPAPVAVKPEGKAAAPTQVASIAPPVPPQTQPAADAAPSQPITAAPAARAETNGSRVASDVLPSAPSPAEKIAGPVKVAAVPAQPVASDDDEDITGSIGPDAKNTTIPVGIGEASSTEIEMTLPRERPPVLLRLDRRRARGSAIDHARPRAHHAARSKTKKAEEPPQFDLFALLFQALAEDFKPVKPTIPYQPNNNWQQAQ